MPYIFIFRLQSSVFRPIYSFRILKKKNVKTSTFLPLPQGVFPLKKTIFKLQRI